MLSNPALCWALLEELLEQVVEGGPAAPQCCLQLWRASLHPAWWWALVEELLDRVVEGGSAAPQGCLQLWRKPLEGFVAELLVVLQVHWELWEQLRSLVSARKISVPHVKARAQRLTAYSLCQ